MSQKPSATALRASLIYGFVAGLWILFSDQLLNELIPDKQQLLRLEIYKGWGFVLFTAGLCFSILRRILQRESQKIDEWKRAEALTRLQKEVLQKIARGKPLAETLEALLRRIEALSPEMLTSILLLENETHLRHGAAPTLPKEYVQAIDGLAIGPRAGSCGTAAFRGSPVFVSDIASDPLWADWKHLALPHQLRACWSTPILDEQKRVLGVFAIYHCQQGLPKDSEVQMIELVTDTAATAIMQARAESNLIASEERYRTLVEHVSDAIFLHDAEGHLLDANQSACASLGYTRHELLGMTVQEIDRELQKAESPPTWLTLAPGPSHIVHGRHWRRDGSSFPVEVSLSSYETKGKLVFAAMARNISERKEYEERLAQSVSLLRATIEASTSGLLVVNPEGEITTCNSRFLEMWRIPATLADKSNDQAILNLVLDQLTDPEAFAQRVNELYKNPEAESHDTLHFKDGRIFDRVSRPQRLGNQIVGRVWSFHDDTAQQQAEKSMRLQSAALQAAANAIVITDARGRIEWANPAFAQTSGYALAECVGKTPRELIWSGQHHREFFREMWTTIQAGQVWHGEVTNRRKDGTLYLEDMTITPLLDAQDRITHFVAIKQDITQRRRMEEELRQAMERTQFYMNRMPLAFIAFDREQRVAEWNHTAEKVFGWSAAEAIGRQADTLIVPADVQPATNRVWKEILETQGDTAPAINENVTKDGRRITCEWRNTPWRDATGQIRGCLSIVTDITDRLRVSQLEVQLRQSQKLEAVGQLSGGIAHDFNNLLTVIQGNAALLQSLSLQPPEMLDCANQIARAGERAASLTRQLLLFARKQQMQPVNLDLNETVAQMTRMLRRILGEDISLCAEYAPGLPLIHADAGMIEQIILNLAVNARDAMPEGGQLTIQTKVEELKPAANPPSPPQPQVRLTVTDSGGGIAPEILPRIFEPFFTTKEVGKGTGLGLATVYGIVQQHHGEITVQNAPGKGTTFQVCFPSVTTPKAAGPEVPARPVLATGTETILLVEDEAPLRTFVRDLLQRCGYTVLEADSGPAALKIWAAQQNRIQLLLTDIIMPENLNGIELGRRLLAEKPALKVIYTSGYAGNLEGRQTALTEGVNFIAKPFKPEALTEIIRQHLDEKTGEL